MAFAYADRGSALPSNLQSASRRGSFTRLPGSLLLRPVKLLAPCADLTGNFPSHRDFYFRASIESVALLDAGYNYDSHWNALSMGLSPIGLTSSLAARPRNLDEFLQFALHRRGPADDRTGHRLSGHGLLRGIPIRFHAAARPRRFPPHSAPKFRQGLLLR